MPPIRTLMKDKFQDPPEDKEVDINVMMPRILILDNTSEAIKAAEKVTEMLTYACTSLINANRDPQLCMSIINHVFERDRTLFVALNRGQKYDLDHFRLTMVALATAYEYICGGHMIQLSDPVDFDEIMELRMEGRA